MSNLNVCTFCSGFLPRVTQACPHCGAVAPSSGINGWRGSATVRGLVAVATGGAVAVTLMACYGAPPGGPDIDSDGDGFDELSDCNDNDSSVHPEAPDPTGDGIDQNCDGIDGDGDAGDGGGGGADGGKSCTESCGEAITSGIAICNTDTKSLGLYNSYKACLCGDGVNTGPCAIDCADGFCTGQIGSAACSDCIFAATMSGGQCEPQSTACVNDP